MKKRSPGSYSGDAGKWLFIPGVFWLKLTVNLSDCSSLVAGGRRASDRNAQSLVARWSDGGFYEI
jgi:hypothetical protein